MSTEAGAERRSDARIVVGVDGSVSAQHALRWAMRQATLTGTPIEAITVWERSPYHRFSSSLDADLSAAARHVLDAAISDAMAVTGISVRIEAHVLSANPAAALVNAAAGSDLLVVGSHGRGGFTQAMLGSVSQRCTQHAACPVVVVRAYDG